MEKDFLQELEELDRELSDDNKQKVVVEDQPIPEIVIEENKSALIKALDVIQNLPIIQVKLPQVETKKETEIVESITYTFDYKHPYIEVSFKKPKSLQGYQETEFRQDLQYNIGQYVFKGAKFRYQNNIDIFSRILQKYPDGVGYNKYTPAFMMAALRSSGKNRKSIARYG